MRSAHRKHGDQLPWRIRFAWFPVDIYDSHDERWYSVWLERYTEQRTWVVKQRPTKFGYDITCGAWEVQRKMIKKC